MTFLNKLDYLMDEKGYNKHTMAEASGIPYTTIVGWYTKGYDRIKLSTIQRLAEFFGTTLDYLVREDITDRNFEIKNPPQLQAGEDDMLQELIDCYLVLDHTGREALLAAARGLSAAFPVKAVPQKERFQVAARTPGNDQGVFVMESTTELLEAEAEEYKRAKEKHKNDDL